MPGNLVGTSRTSNGHPCTIKVVRPSVAVEIDPATPCEEFSGTDTSGSLSPGYISPTSECVVYNNNRIFFLCETVRILVEKLLMRCYCLAVAIETSNACAISNGNFSHIRSMQCINYGEGSLKCQTARCPML